MTQRQKGKLLLLQKILLSETDENHKLTGAELISKLAASGISCERKTIYDDIETLMIAGMLHDIGKLRIPPEIIQKPGRLTDEEYEIVKKHPQYGYDILSTKNLNPKIKLVALQHHERYD